MKISDLHHPITAAKSDWLAADTWIGFTPSGTGPKAEASCQVSIVGQMGGGYILEYITVSFGKTVPGQKNNPSLNEEKRVHALKKGRLVAVHKLRVVSRPLKDIVGIRDFNNIQDIWDITKKRNRWSVAFPVVESYSILGNPLAKEVFGPLSYKRLFGRQSAGLRILNDDDRNLISDLNIEQRNLSNARIEIEYEFLSANRSDIDSRIIEFLEEDLADMAFEGSNNERRQSIKKRAMWLANKFANYRKSINALFCDNCGFNPTKFAELSHINPRTLLDVHHKNPLSEGERYTSTQDFSLLCPTCHRIEHEILKRKLP